MRRAAGLARLPELPDRSAWGLWGRRTVRYGLSVAVLGVIVLILLALWVLTTLELDATVEVNGTLRGAEPGEAILAVSPSPWGVSLGDEVHLRPVTGDAGQTRQDLPKLVGRVSQVEVGPDGGMVVHATLSELGGAPAGIPVRGRISVGQRSGIDLVLRHLEGGLHRGDAGKAEVP